jgi:toxin HigB-1
MDVAFGSKGLKDLCEQSKAAQRKLGTASAGKLRSRLADLVAAKAVTDLVAGRPHPLKGDRAGQFALDLSAGQRLVFEPDHDPIPTRDDDAIDWARVTKVRIVLIGDYHV